MQSWRRHRWRQLAATFGVAFFIVAVMLAACVIYVIVKGP